MLITPDKKGISEYIKISAPVKYGRYIEIKTDKYIFDFNLNGEIKRIQGRPGTWFNHNEWFKRTISNDWIYYSSGGYNGSYENTGEYYTPCFRYDNNSITGGDFPEDGRFDDALSNLAGLLKNLLINKDNYSCKNKEIINFIQSSSPDSLLKQTEDFHKVTNGVISVLPPDTRHSDYEIIPLDISDGCLYHCKFCSVKSKRKYRVHSKEEITSRIEKLEIILGADKRNYNSIFLGQHDALNAGCELIEYAALNAWRVLQIDNSFMKYPALYLFGSISSLANTTDDDFFKLNQLPFMVYINLGLESCDEITLNYLGKPVVQKNVEDTFFRVLDLNNRFKNVHLSVNFLISHHFSEKHYLEYSKLMSEAKMRKKTNGTVYLSPYGDIRDKRSLLKTFRRMKAETPLDTFLYIIQRL